MSTVARRPYRWIFIDWHGTLSTSLFWGHRPELAPLSALLFSPEGKHCGLIEPWVRGALTSEEVVQLVAHDANVAYDIALNELITSCQGMVLVASEVLNLVASLREQGTKVVIATDNMDTFCRWTAPSLGLDQHFDDILCSAELRALKWEADATGSSPFFGQLLAREGIGPGESILLDDNAAIEAHIRAFGIDFHQITPDSGLVKALRDLNAQQQLPR
jgi:FMN phosphatase YigB (HAD superfamily)